MSVSASDMLSSVLQIPSQWQKENTRQWKAGPYGDEEVLAPTTRSVLHCEGDLTGGTRPACLHSNILDLGVSVSGGAGDGSLRRTQWGK